MILDLEGWAIYQYVDGIDFDWENSGAAVGINNLAPAFKKAGYVVTSAPMASQLHGGCGYKWQWPTAAPWNHRPQKNTTN